MSKNKSFRNTSGISALEFAVTLPFILILVTGALDICRLLQAKNALYEGVRAAIRCSATTDGKCVQTTAPDVIQTYKYYQFSILEPAIKISGVGSWLLMPNYTASNYRAKVLDSGEYEADFKKYETKEEFWDAQGRVRYFIENDRTVPRVVNPRDPLGTGLENTNRVEVEPSNRRAAGSSNKCGDKNSVEIGTIRIDVPNLETVRFGDTLGQTLKCYRDSYNSDSTRHNPCTYLNDISYTRLMLIIQGDSEFGGSDTAIGVGGKLTIRAENLYQETINNSIVNIDEINTIGGRVWSGPGKGIASLAPRGLTEKTINNAWGDNVPYQEIQSYSSLLARPGSTVLLHFKLQRTTDCNNAASPPIRYTLKNLEVHTINPTGDETYETCNTPLKRSTIRSEANTPASCTVAGRDHVIKLQETPGSAPKTIGAAYGTDCEGKTFNREDIIRAAFKDKPLPAEYATIEEMSEDYSPAYTLESSNQCPKSKSFTCSDNFGVSTKEQFDEARNRNYIADSGEARSACNSSVLNSDLSTGVTPTFVSFFETTKHLQADPLTLNNQDCTFTKQTLRNFVVTNTSFGDYKKLDFDFAKSGETARVTGTVAPESYRVSAPDIFACSQVQVSAPLIFNDSNASLADTSIFKKYNLEEDICNKEESARGEAEKYGLLKNAYFVVNETDRKMVHVTQPPDANSCATWEVDSDQSIPKVYRGEHNQGIVPAECKQSATGQNTCITTPGTVKVVNKSNDPYLNLNDQAVKTLKTTFGAFYGGADTATVVCAKDAKNCLDTKVVLDPVSKIVTASASINVKLYTENFPIIGDSIKAIGVVTEKQMQPWEGKFASGRY